MAVAKPPKKKKAEAPERPDVERGDEVFFQHGDGPCVGKIVCHGKTGCMAQCEHGRHRVRWEHVLGHKVRVQPDYHVVHDGEDGALVEDGGGRRRFIRDLTGPAEPVHKAIVTPLIFTTAPDDLFKAIKNAPGLALQGVTDKGGHQTKRWKKTAAEQPKGRQKKAPEAAGLGAHNVKSGDHVSFRLGSLQGHGEIVGTPGNDGAHVRDESGHVHQVSWSDMGDGEAKPAQGCAGKGGGSGNTGAPGGGGKGGGDPPSDGGDDGGDDDLSIDEIEADVAERVERAKLGEPFSDEKYKKLPEKSSSRFKSWDEIAAAQPKAQEELTAVLEGLAAKVGAKAVAKLDGEHLDADGAIYALGPPKTFEQSEKKVAGKYKGDWSRLGDAVRASIGFDSPAELRAGATHLESVVDLASWPDNKFPSPTGLGYRDINLNISLPCGVVAEVQIHLKDVLRAKKIGHPMYKEAEGLAKKRSQGALSPEETARFGKLNGDQRRLYGQAMLAAFTRDS